MKKPNKKLDKSQTIQTVEEFELNSELDMLEEHEDMLYTKESFNTEIIKIEQLLSDLCKKADKKYKYNFGAVQDGLLMRCKDLAMNWMRNPTSATDEEVEILWNFVLLSLEHLRLLKIKHNMQNMQSVPWVELNQGIEEAKTAGMMEVSQEVNFTKVFREIEFLSVQFVLLYSVFEKIIQERNLFVQ